MLYVHFTLIALNSRITMSFIHANGTEYLNKFSYFDETDIAHKTIKITNCTHNSPAS